MENLQKRSKEVNTYKLSSIKHAIEEIEVGIGRCKIQINQVAHELDRLRVILTSSDPSYLEQLEINFDESCKTVSERLQELRIRKLTLKKHSKVSFSL